MPLGRTIVASRTLLAIDRNGQEFEIAMAVGEPYQAAESEWACSVSTEGLYGQVSDQHGVNSWQAYSLHISSSLSC